MLRKRHDSIGQHSRGVRTLTSRLVLAGLTAAALFLAGCQMPTSTPTPETTVVSSVRVIDGDTISIVLDGAGAKVRLLGVDTPEHGACGFQEATQRLRELVGGRAVVLVADPYTEEHDRFGRILAYVEVDQTDVGRVLIVEGLAGAWWPASAPEPARGADYRRAQADARQRGAGSWGACGVVGRG